MNEVTLRTDAASKEIDGGLEIAVTCTVCAQAGTIRWIATGLRPMNGHQGWSTKAAPLPNGELLTVTATDPKEIQHIRGLGFIGLLVSDSHQAAPSRDGKGRVRQQAPGPDALNQLGLLAGLRRENEFGCHQ
jgi:hypothetical protein